MAVGQVVCPACGHRVPAVRFCGDCGEELPLGRVAAGVSFTKGDTGRDESRTHIDNSTHQTSQRDSHDVRTEIKVDNSQYHVHSHFQEAHQRSTLVWWVAGAALTLAATLVKLYWPSPPAAQPPVVVNVPVTVGAPMTQPPVEPPATTAPPAVTRPVDDRPELQAQVVSRPSSTPGPPVAAVPDPAPTVAAPAAPTPPSPVTYVNTGAARAGATYVLMVDVRTGADAVLTQQVAALVNGSDDLFKPAFIREGLFSRVHQGDLDTLRELIDAEVGRVILGTRLVTLTPTQVAGQSLVRASVTLNTRVIEPSRGYASRVATATEVGAGFDDQGAIALATEHALKKLAPQVGR